MRILSTIFFITFSSICLTQSASASKIYRTNQFYTISGNTAVEIDRSLSRLGPFIKTTGSRHLGATNLKFISDIRIEQQGRYCKVVKARIDIQAKILLPRWKQRNTTSSPELALIWDVLYSDIRRHEESHVIIARAHASEIEYALRSLYYRRNCNDLENDVNKVITRIMADHDRAQAYYENVETINFEKRFTRLLDYRLEQIKNRRLAY